MFGAALRFLAAATPSQCEVCRAWPAEPLCDRCAARFTPATPRCGTCALAVPAGVARCGRCLASPPPLDRCEALVSYGFPWSALVAGLKFSARPGWTAPLARRMGQHAGIRAALEDADLVLPMPLAPGRLAQRGFNQAWELARRLAPGRADAGLVLRVRETPPQARLDRAERLANLRHAFAPDPRRAAALRGRRVVLVDDVMTSGASLFALAEAVRQAGAAGVAAVVLARTED